MAALEVDVEAVAVVLVEEAAQRAQHACLPARRVRWPVAVLATDRNEHGATAPPWVGGDLPRGELGLEILHRLVRGARGATRLVGLDLEDHLA